MRKLLPLVLLLVGVASGIGAGIVLHDGDVEGDPRASSDKAEKKASAGKKADKYDMTDREFLKLSKQFVVPLLDGDHLVGLANLALSLEVAPGLSDQFYSREPKIRDAFLQVLFDHANMGGFDGAFTMSSKLDPLRQALLEAAHRELGPDGVHTVLIVDIARQDHY